MSEIKIKNINNNNGYNSLKIFCICEFLKLKLIYYLLTFLLSHLFDVAYCSDYRSRFHAARTKHFVVSSVNGVTVNTLWLSGLYCGLLIESASGLLTAASLSKHGS
jgi:hypothetical protein